VLTVIVALAFTTLIGHLIFGWQPGPIIVQWKATIAIHTVCIVLAITTTVYHAALVFWVVAKVIFDGLASGRVAIAQATTKQGHLGKGIVVLFAYVFTAIEQVVAERVQTCEINTQICYFQ
jgi:hypothetical protein